MKSKIISRICLLFGLLITICFGSYFAIAAKSTSISQSYFDDKMLLKLTFDDSKAINEITKKEYVATGTYEEGTKLSGYMPNRSSIAIDDLNLNNEECITVAFSFKFDAYLSEQNKNIIPISFNNGKYSIKISNNSIGFTTNGIDLFGNNYKFESNKWYNIIATFNKNNLYNNKIFINGVKCNNYQINGTPINRNINFNSSAINISSSSNNPSYMLKDKDIIDEVYVLKGDINDSEVNYLYLYHRIPDFRANIKESSSSNNKELNLSWALDILDTDLFLARYYDHHDEQNLIWYASPSNGKQQLSNQDVYQGKYSLKVNDTITYREGNHFNFPQTDSTWSIHTFGMINQVPPSTNVSMSVKLKANTSDSFYSVAGDGGWEIGREFDKYRAKTTKIAPVGTYEIYVDDISEFILQSYPNNNVPAYRYHITSDKNKDILIDQTIDILKVYPLSTYEKIKNTTEFINYMSDIKTKKNEQLQITEDTKEYKLEKYTGVKTPGVLIISAPINTQIEVGENLKTRQWYGPIHFSNIYPIPDNEWHVYNSNTKTGYNPYYNILTRGFNAYANVGTSGTVYADSLKIGYATEAIIRKNGNIVYRGYGTEYKDNSIKDIAKPNIVDKDTITVNTSFKNSKNPTNDRLIHIRFNEVEDIGTTYNYTIQSISRSGNPSPESNPIVVSEKSGIKGYSYIIDKNKNTEPDNKIDSIEKSQDNKNIIKYSITDSGVYYLHIAAIDNENNMGEILHLPISVPVLKSEANSKGNYINLNWSMDEMNEPFQFKVFKKKEDEAFYQSGSMMNFDSDVKIQVLNVYPTSTNDEEIPIIPPFETHDGEYIENLPKSASLKMWMEGVRDKNGNPIESYGKNPNTGKYLIEVHPISIEEFNKNSNSILKNSDNTWKYDVVFFGSWDVNGYRDISENTVPILEEYIDSGRGVLFGHDTILYSPEAEIYNHANFSKFAGYVGIKTSWQGGNYGSNKVKVNKKGILTNFPYKIDGELTIPLTHSINQLASSDIWAKFIDAGTVGVENEGVLVETKEGTNNFYLTSKNNTAMIQTGHSKGEATPDEQKMLANTLFYLKQLSTQKEVKDMSSQDMNPPQKPSIKEHKFRDGYMVIDFMLNKSEDIGTIYQHYIEASGQAHNQTRVSNITKTEIKTGLKGYSYIVDSNPNTEPNNEVNTSSEKITVKVPDSKEFYIHIKAIDNAGNSSDTLHFKVSRSQDFFVDSYNLQDKNNQYVGDLEHGQKYNINLALASGEVSNNFIKKIMSSISNLYKDTFVDISFKSIKLFEITDEDLDNKKSTTELVKDNILLDDYDKFKLILNIDTDIEKPIEIDELEWKIYSGGNIIKKSNLIKEGILTNIISNENISIDFDIRDIQEGHDKITIVAKYNKVDKNLFNNKIEQTYTILRETNDTIVDTEKSLKIEKNMIENPKYETPKYAQENGTGTSYYKSSNIREWLNSDDSLVEYTMPKPSRDIHGIYAYDDEVGFLYGFTEEEKQAIGVTKRKSFNFTTKEELLDGGNISDGIEMDFPLQSTSAIYENITTSWNDYKYTLVNDKIFLLNAVEYYNYIELRGFEKTYYLMDKAQEKYNYTDSVRWYLGDSRLEYGLERDKTSIVTENGSIIQSHSTDISLYRYGIVPAFHLKPTYVFSNGIKATDLKIGDNINFGTYRGEVIPWKVINITNDGYPLLICDKAIDIKAYNTKSQYVYKESKYINFNSFDIDISNDLQKKAISNNDITSPKLTLVNEEDVLNKRQSGAYKITINATDENGIKFIILPNGEKKYSSTVDYIAESNGEYTFIACDTNDNYRELSIPVGNINIESHAMATPSTKEWTNKDVEVDIRASNDVSYNLTNDIQNRRDENFKWWSNYINYKGKRLRYKGKIKFNSSEKDLGNIVVGPGANYNTLSKNKNGDYILKRVWKYAARWKLEDLKKLQDGYEFDIIYTISDDYYNDMSIFTQMDVSSVENAYSVLWEKLDVELVDNDEFGIKKIVLPTGKEIAQSSYIDTLTEEGTYTYTIYDNRGESVKRDVTVKIDKVKPILQITGIPTEWTNQAIELDVVGSDDRSGVEKIVLPNGSETKDTSFKYRVSQNGTYTFEIYDVAGNKNTKTITINNVDTKAPSLGLDYEPKGWTASNVVISANAIDLDSGVKNIKLPNGQYVNRDTAKYTVTSNGQYIFEAEDNQGNKTKEVIQISNIDKEKPFLKSFYINGDFENATINMTVDDLNSGIKRVKLPNGEYIENTNSNSKQLTLSYKTSKTLECTFELEDMIGHINIVKIYIEGIDSRAISPIISEEIQDGVLDPVINTVFLDNNDRFKGYARADIPAGYLDQVIDTIKWEAYTGTDDNLKVNKVGNGIGKDIKVENKLDGGQALLPLELKLSDIPKTHTKLTFVTTIEDRDDYEDSNNILEVTYNIEYALNDIDSGGWIPPSPTFFDEMLDNLKYTITSSNGGAKNVLLSEGELSNIKVPINKKSWISLPFTVPTDKDMVDVTVKVEIQDSNDSIQDNNITIIKFPIIPKMENDIGLENITVYPSGNTSKDKPILGTPISIKANVVSTNIRTQNATAILRVNGKKVEEKQVYGISADMPGSLYFTYILHEFSKENIPYEELNFEIEVIPSIKEDFTEEKYKNKSDIIPVKVYKEPSADIQDGYNNSSKSNAFTLNQEVVVYQKVEKNDKTKLVKNKCGKDCQSDKDGNAFCPGHTEFDWEDTWYTAYVPVDTHTIKDVKEEIELLDVKFRSKFTKSVKSDYTRIIDNDGKLSILNPDGSINSTAEGLIKVKAGYGFEIDMETKYKNNLPEKFNSYTLNVKKVDDALLEKDWTRYKKYDNANMDLITTDIDNELKKYSKGVLFTVPAIEDIGIEYPNRIYMKTPAASNEYLEINKGLKVQDLATSYKITDKEYTYIKKYKIGNKDNSINKYYVSADTKNSDSYVIRLFTPRIGVGASCYNGLKQVKDKVEFKIHVYGGYLDDLKTQLNE